MKNFCMMCGTQDPDDFTLYHHSMLCDDCKSICDYWYNEAFTDAKARYRALRGAEMWESEFLEGLQEYIDIAQTRYNEERRKK